MNKVEALAEAITQDLVRYLVLDNNLEVKAAMILVYCSKLFDKLNDKETGLYLEGSAYVYELLKDELARNFSPDYVITSADLLTIAESQKDYQRAKNSHF